MHGNCIIFVTFLLILKLVNNNNNKMTDTYLTDQLFPEGRSRLVSFTLAELGAPGSLALGLLPPGQALSAPCTGHKRAVAPLRPPAGEPRDLLGTISSSVLKSTAVGPAGKSSLQSLSRSGMLKALSSWSLERDTGEGWAWRTEDLFFLMGEA